MLRHSRRPAPRDRRSRFTLDDPLIRAHAHPCPGVPGMVAVVVLDTRTVASVEHYRRWGLQLAALGFTQLRTGALPPRHAAQAEMAGLTCVQHLSLLELTPTLHRGAALAETLPGILGRRGADRLFPTTPLRLDDLHLASAIDRAAFGTRWWLDGDMLAEVCLATPKHRARAIGVGQAVDPDGGFLISGRAGRTGYLQRLAVQPHRQRAGLATSLVVDALSWMRRHRVDQVYVNTHLDNHAALALYRRHGFAELRERLAVFEGPIVG